jgi:hypothetical protein
VIIYRLRGKEAQRSNRGRAVRQAAFFPRPAARRRSAAAEKVARDGMWPAAADPQSAVPLWKPPGGTGKSPLRTRPAGLRRRRGWG